MSNNYFATYAEDLQQEPFDATDFVERLAWRLTGDGGGGGGGGGGGLDAVGLHGAFEEEISSLQLLSDQYQSKIVRLQALCDEDERSLGATLGGLQQENARCVGRLKQLDERVNAVAAKVVHLGDQLESVHAPRSRAHDALQLMRHFDEFLSEQPLDNDVFTDPDRLLEAAEAIHKLAAIAHELSAEKFGKVRARIGLKYDEIEGLMIEEFIRTHRLNNRQKLKQIADILVNFKGYSQCIDGFVEHIQIGAFRSANIFDDMLHLFEKTYPLLSEIFPNSDQVMGKLVLNVFHGKFQEYIKSKLSDPEDPEVYLANLYELYSKTQKLVDRLPKFKAGADKEFMPALVRALFNKHLEAYVAIELQFLRDQCANILHKYYESVGHQKRAVLGGGIQDVKRDLQTRIFTPESFGGQTFLSEEVAINMLQETKQAFARCQLLCGASEAPTNAELILDVLQKYLCQEHLEYAVELALYGIPLSEPRTPPQPQFFGVVRQAAAICHLFEKQFDDSILPIVRHSASQQSAVAKKRHALYNLELKLSNGLDRQLNAIVGYARFVLASEQKKTDFRPEQEEQIVPQSSAACTTVVRFVEAQAERLRDCVDGANLDAALADLAVRLHRVLLEHVYQFVYSSAGAVLLLCDVNAYRKCVGAWGCALANELFETLHALCNLLMVVPDNLHDAVGADLLAAVDRQVVANFVQLRADYRSAKLFYDFR